MLDIMSSYKKDGFLTTLGTGGAIVTVASRSWRVASVNSPLDPRASPVVRASKQETIDNSVVLPAPLGPSRPKISPSSTSKEAPSSARTSR